jgi:nitrite reductase (cytochrome c-552)
MSKALYALGFVAAAGAGVGIALLLGDIKKHQVEATVTNYDLVKVDEKTSDPAEWGKNHPRQYDSYKRTVDMERTRYGGSEADPKKPSATSSHIEADPRLVTMWKGYAFAVDFREERGHAYMLQDQKDTERQKVVKQPGACLHCHASIPTLYRAEGIKAGAPGDGSEDLCSAVGKEQLMKGFDKVCAMPYAEAAAMAKHPVACIDCHDPKSMALRVTRPGFLDGIAVLAKSSEATPALPSVEKWRKGDRKGDYDPNRDASRQEMRSFVCGQCHVEYYFKGDAKRLTYPWHNGVKVENILSYYDAPNFKDNKPYKDFAHKISGAPALKAQHPEFELWSQGVHARAGVACADCHMPYVREGAMKVSDHQIRSPMLMIDKACQTCHRASEAEMKARCELIQDRTKALMDRALNGLCDLIKDIEAAQTGGATDEQLVKSRDFQRQAQFRIDFINAENSMGFHAPQEAARILGEACDFARQGQVDLAKAGLGKAP